MNKFRNELSKASVVNVVLGLILLIAPATSVKLIGYGIGGAVLVFGAVSIISGLRNGGGLFGGFLSCLVGIFIWTRFPALVSFLPFVVGIVVFVSGLSKLQGALEAKRDGYRWVPGLIAAILSVGLGIMVICNPFSTLALTLRVIGLVLLLDGAENLIEAWVIRRRLKEQGYLAKEGEDGIIDIVTDDED